MPLSYGIDPNRDLALIQGRGVVTDEELLACIEKLKSDPELSYTMPVLWDIREVDVKFTSRGIGRAIEILRRASDRRGSSNAAIVATNKTAFGMARMFQMMSEGKSFLEFRVFSSRTAALAWLKPQDSASVANGKLSVQDDGV